MSFQLLKKVASVITLITFLSTNSIYAAPDSKSIFKNKKIDYQKLSDKNKEAVQKKKAILSGEDTAQSESRKKETQKILSSHLSDISLIHIPEELGRVVEVYQNPDQDSSRLIVHIQDLHTNPEATLNLAGILEILVKDYNLGLVCSEGADGVVDTSSVSSFPDPEVRKKVARLFVDSGELTGEEYLSITKYPELPIWGIENKEIYFKNIAEFNNIMKFNPDSQVFISQAKKALEELKPKIYSKELLTIDQKESDYENQKAETADYLKYISFYLQKLNIPTANYKNVALLNETINQESGIDQQKIMQESQNLLLNLQSTIAEKSNRSDMDALIAKASLFKDRKISPFSFYSYLKDLANKHLKDQLAKYPNLTEFVDYLAKVNSLDSTKLFTEMEDLTYEIKQKLARNDEEKAFIQALRNIKFLESFFNLKVSNEELDYYLQNKESCKVSFFENFLKPALKKSNLSNFIDFNPDLIDSHLQELEDFYNIAKSRDFAMFNNTVSEIEKRNIKVSALITGGFHTKGLTRLLKDKGYSYIVISPYSKTEIDEENYRYLLSGKRKPIEELIKQLNSQETQETANKPPANLRVPLTFDRDLSGERVKEGIDALASNAGLEKMLADYSYFEANYIEAIKLLFDISQEHLFANWDKPGMYDDLKKKFLDQIIEMDKKFPGGLKQYRENVKNGVKNVIAGVNPFEGFNPQIPDNIFNLDTREKIDSVYHAAETFGLALVNKLSIVLVAGGRGDRLKYDGIKIDLPLDLITERKYIEHFLEAREAFEQSANTEIPFTIMTSYDNHESTKDLFKNLGYQVISDNDGKTVMQKGKSKIVMVMQGLVPVVANRNGDFVIDPKEPYKLLTKPHGHGDVHMLLAKYGLVDEWISAGKEYTVFIQDTNGQVFNGILVGLADTARNNLDLNFLTVPREAGEKAGAITKLVGPHGNAIICNVEYNQLDPLLKHITGQGDVADPKTGKSPYPANLNVYFVKNTTYREALGRTKGIMPEFVNPKFTNKENTEFEPTRFETMMQDIAKVLNPNANVGVTNYSAKRDIFSPVKNDYELAEKALANGNYPDHMATGEGDYYKYNRKLLRLAGMGVNVEGTEQKTQGRIPYSEGTKVSLYHNFATTTNDVMSKIKRGSITKRSTLIIDGKDVFLENVDIDGTLIVRVASGVKLKIKYLKVENHGWEFVQLTPGEMRSSDIPEYFKIRGYKLVRKGEKIIDIKYPGEYEIGPDGVLINKTLASNEGIAANIQAAVKGDKDAYLAIKNANPSEVIAYFEAGLAGTITNLPEDLFGRGYGYDIRGNALEIKGGIIDITPENLYAIGKLLALKYLKPGDGFLVTGDIRLHTPILRYAMALGAASVGAAVDFSEEALSSGAHNAYSAENPIGYKAQVQLSGSHGVFQKNGAKIKVNLGNNRLDPVYGEELAALYAEKQELMAKARARNVIDAKVNEVSGIEKAIVDMYDGSLPFTEKDEILIIDTRAGGGGSLASKLFAKRVYEVIDIDEVFGILGQPADMRNLLSDQNNINKILRILNEKWNSGKRKIVFMLNAHPDPLMGRGIWDPSKPEAMVPTVTLIKAINANLREGMPQAIGGVYDGDADRVGAVKENGEDIPAFEMTIPYYQRFLLDASNKAAIIAMVKAGGEPLWLACDVRANSKLNRTINKLNRLIKGEGGLSIDPLKSVYINTGYPPQLTFIAWRIELMKAFVNSKPELRDNPEFMANFANLTHTYYTAEASGHNFFHVAPENPERPCDCAIAAFVSLINIKETIGNVEAPAIGIRGYAEQPLVTLFKAFPIAFTSNEIRVVIPNAVKIATAHKLGAWLHEKYNSQLLEQNIGGTEVGDLKYQPVEDGLITVAGYKVQLKNGDSILIRWSNTGEQLTLLFEGHDMDSLLNNIEIVYNRMLEEKQNVPGLDLADLEKEIKRIKEEKVKDMRKESTKLASNENEKRGAGVIAEKLTTPLDANGNTGMAASFLRGGYGQEGYGVQEGASVHGSFALTGNQGYYAQGGKEVFLNTVDSMQKFFKRRAERLGKPIKYVIKTGIGGQHTPFQGIADVFQVINARTGKVAGEYELGKDFEASMASVLRDLNADWDQVAVIPSSKSGSTDETMMVFVDILSVLLKHQAINEGIDGERFARLVLDILHEVNFIDGKERPGKDLFKVDGARFGTTSLISLIANNASRQGLNVTRGQVKDIFGKVLGNMFFETTDRADQSRLSAFIRNSGLDAELGSDAPGFGAMFDNVGGRWTGDLHMMTFLAYHGLDAEKYWNIARAGRIQVKEGSHIANRIGDKILDESITDIALVVPDELFWFGKSNEQNFNESIWQNGFANLVAIRKSQWDAQKEHYRNDRKKLVIDMTGDAAVYDASFNVVAVKTRSFGSLTNQEVANAFAELFTTFYGITTVVGDRLIDRALREAGYTADDVDLNNVNNPATKIVQENLYVRQPYVELGKGLLETKLKALQEREKANPGAIESEFDSIKQLAREGKVDANINELGLPANITNLSELASTIRKADGFARANGRKFVPFIYLEGDRFYNLRDYLISLGIEWVMQGTGDQHISYQQVLAQPQKYLPFIISFVPEKTLPGRPAIGFAKGYLDNVSPHMVRDLFAEASYKALTESRKDQGGLGLFLRIIDSEDNISMLKQAAQGLNKLAATTNPFLLFKAGRDRGNITIDQNTIIIAMGGGDTAGLNDFLADTVEKLTRQGYKVIGVRSGFKGLKSGKLEDNLVELTPEIAASMRGLPSIALGSCREKLKEEDITKIVDILQPSAGAIFIGGNDHLKNVEQVADEAKKQNVDITIVGVPKSIDNDFMTVMHGFWSAVITGRQIAARASINSEKEIANTAAVFECMGRKSGSLTLELSKGCPYSHAVIVPEKPIMIDDIINTSNKGIRNFFVSEGFSLSEADPKLSQLLEAYPMLKTMWEKSRTSPDRDVHGNPKLTGASLFVKGILEHFCGLRVEKTDLTYQLRGAFLQPDNKGIVFDTFLAGKFAEEAVSLIDTKQSGFAVTYNGEYGDTNGMIEAKSPKDVYKSRDLSTMLSDKSLADLGVLGVSGYQIKYNAVPDLLSEKKVTLEAAIREAFYGIAVSTFAHRYASVVELKEPSDVIISSCGRDQADIDKLPYDLKTVIGGTKDSVLLLVPEKPKSLSQIADSVKDICDKSGYVNIAISKDFMLDPKDELLESVLKTDPVLRVRFKEGIVDDKTGMVRFESGVSNFIVGLYKYLIKQGKIKVEGTKITDLGYAFKGLNKSSDFNLGNRLAIDSGA